MINWKEIYENTLKKICEADSSDFYEIVEIERPEFSSELVKNENATENSLFTFKLDDNATEEDYKNFVTYIYGYIGEDINDYIVSVEEETTKPNEEKGENEMEEKKIRDLLKRYGAEDNEIENFMADLKDTKEEIEEEIEEDEDYVLSPKNLEVLKATEDGKDLIMRAPEMTKEELKKAIYDFLNNKKGK